MSVSSVPLRPAPPFTSYRDSDDAPPPQLPITIADRMQNHDDHMDITQQLYAHKQRLSLAVDAAYGGVGPLGSVHLTASLFAASAMQHFDALRAVDQDNRRQRHKQNKMQRDKRQQHKHEDEHEDADENSSDEEEDE